MKKNGLFTVSEFARLRGLTAETLRHYDRIGLLKPAYIDKETGYRYYSIIQYEKLGTIKELRQLGLPLDVITDYFKDRNLEKSKDILEKSYQVIMKKREELERLEKTVKDKLEYIDNINKLNNPDVVRIISVEDRYVVRSEDEVIGEDEMGFEWTSLEKNLTELSPILATSRIGYYYDFMENGQVENIKKTPFIFVDEDAVVIKKIKEKIPGGQYVDIYTQGFKNFQRAYDSLVEFIVKNNYTTQGKVLTFFPVDITLTDEDEEGMLEIQLKII